MTPQAVVIEDITIVIYDYNEEDIQQLNEAKYKGRELTSTYSYDIHQPHNPTGDYHIHLYDSNVEILSMNKGGSAHDGYHGARFPNRAFKALVKQFPDWKWPSNKILESADYTYIMPQTHSLRPVTVFPHRNFNAQNVDGFIGFFHQFIDDPFIAGGGQGFVARTVAIVEKEDGRIQKVPVDSFRFIDV